MSSSPERATNQFYIEHAGGLHDDQIVTTAIRTSDSEDTRATPLDEISGFSELSQTSRQRLAKAEGNLAFFGFDDRASAIQAIEGHIQ